MCGQLLSRALVFMWISVAMACGKGMAAGPDTTDPTQLRQEQQAVFGQMLTAPDDLDLMFRHVSLSVALRDYESAISTLERILIYRQDLTGVRLELAAAYFNLGSYETAKLYFEMVLADPETDDETRDRVNAYLQEIAKRTQESSFSLVATAGITFASNANLAPQDNNLVINGVPGFVLDPSSRNQSDFGVRTTLAARHSFDLGRANEDAWLTDFSFFGLRYFDVERGNTLFFRTRTGPKLALSAERFGPTLRPYVEGQYLNGEDDSIYFAGLAGVEYTQPVDPQWRVFADLNAGGYFFTEDRDAQTRLDVSFIGGGVYTPRRNLLARLGLVLGYENADADFNSNFEIGAQVSSLYRYDPGFAGIDQAWTLSGYADVRYRNYAEADPLIDPNEERADVDFRVGITHVFALSDDFGVQFNVEGLLRQSSIRNFDLDNIAATISARYQL